MWRVANGLDNAVRPCKRWFLPKFSFSRVSEIKFYQNSSRDKFFELLLNSSWLAKNSRKKSSVISDQKWPFLTTSFSSRVSNFFRTFCFREFWKLAFTEIFESNKKMTLNSSRLDLQKLIPTQKPTRKPTWNFEFKFRMQGPTTLV